ncbi:MAG: hypothetical protein O2854_04945 [Chloroflexi bacterium]|nr:hypothetical protein [Chloroflexota bacterium]
MTDDPRDLMKSGLSPDDQIILDVGNNDYFDHNIEGCPDFADSVFLEPALPGAVLPVDWPAEPPEAIKPLSCDLEATARSVEQGSSAIVEFLNATGSAIQVNWINFQGERQLLTTLSPWSRGKATSFGSYPFVLADFQGNCLSTLITPDKDGRMIHR